MRMDPQSRDARIAELKEKRHRKALNTEESVELVKLCAEQRQNRPGGPDSIGRPKPKPGKSR